MKTASPIEKTVTIDEVVELLADGKIRAEVESLARGRSDQRKKIEEWGKALLRDGGITAVDMRRYISEVTHRDVSITTIRSMFSSKKSSRDSGAVKSGKSGSKPNSGKK